MKKSIIPAVFLFILGSGFLFSLDMDVSGEWELTIQTPRGERTQQMVIEQDGENLTVIMSGRMGEVECEGTLKDNEIEWVVNRSTPRGEITITYTGTVEDDKMNGEVSFGNFGSGEWSAVRSDSNG
ncbi:MAG: hypothetical protein ACOC6P_02240 [Candidatus Aminicenantaceae bacterium]